MNTPASDPATHRCAASSACWVVAPGRAELRTESLPPMAHGQVRVRTLHSAISRGTEGLVLRGEVPASEYERMREPFQAGNFPGPVKYGYINVGRVEQGPAALLGRTVFCLYPHQTLYQVPADAGLPVPPGVPGGRAVLAALLETAINALPHGPVRLLCVATVTPRKGHALLLQALAGLQQLPCLCWELHCVGSLARDPATAARVQAMAREPALAGRVIWHGEVDAAVLQAHYAAADLLVLASLHEGYGMVVAEALAAGLPVLASDAGALAQTLPALAGWRVPLGDVAALQKALQRLINEPALREQLAAGAREARRQLPDWPTQAARFAAVLDALP